MTEVLVDKFFEDLINLLIIIICVALVDDQLVNFHVLDICGDAIGLASQELQQLVDVILVDKILALIQRDILCHFILFLFYLTKKSKFFPIVNFYY